MCTDWLICSDPLTIFTDIQPTTQFLLKMGKSQLITYSFLHLEYLIFNIQYLIFASWSPAPPSHVAVWPVCPLLPVIFSIEIQIISILLAVSLIMMSTITIVILPVAGGTVSKLDRCGLPALQYKLNPNLEGSWTVQIKKTKCLEWSWFTSTLESTSQSVSKNELTKFGQWWQQLHWLEMLIIFTNLTKVDTVREHLM